MLLAKGKSSCFKEDKAKEEEGSKEEEEKEREQLKYYIKKTNLTFHYILQFVQNYRDMYAWRNWKI